MMADQAFAPSPDHRTFALHRLLTASIKAELVRHRYALEIPATTDEGTLSQAKQTIARDARTLSPELIAWSWLYYHFVRVEFNLTPNDFSRIAAMDERTLRRHQQHGIWRLTQLLIVQEQIIHQSDSGSLYQALFAQNMTLIVDAASV